MGEEEKTHATRALLIGRGGKDARDAGVIDWARGKDARDAGVIDWARGKDARDAGAIDWARGKDARDAGVIDWAMVECPHPRWGRGFLEWRLVYHGVAWGYSPETPTGFSRNSGP